MIRRDPHCTLCRLHKTAKHVCLLGDGPEPSKIMIIGEAPGKNEDERGKPFIGKAGQLLRDTLEDVGIDPEDVFITNAVSCRPPDNRHPSKGEIKSCNAWLKYQMSKVKPRFVLILGSTPYQSITGSTGITKARGQPFEQAGMIFLPTFHPSATFYDPSLTTLFEQDVKYFKEIIENKGIPRENKLNYKTVDSWELFEEMLEALSGDVSYDIETNCLYPWQTHDEKGRPDPARITQIGFGTATGEYMIPVDHPDSPWRKNDIKKMLPRIEERLKKHVRHLITHFGKFDYLWTWVHLGVKWYPYATYDTGLAHHLLDENSLHGLKHLAQVFCGAPNWDIDKKSKQGKQGLKKLGLYHAHDLYYTRQLAPIFMKMMRKEGEIERLFNELTMPCFRLFVEVEYDGVCVNIKDFGKAETKLLADMKNAEERMKKYGDINWGSTKQLATLLFDELGVKPIDKTAGGAWSTSESVIKRIDHPVAGDLLKYRGARQQHSFFIDGWKPFLHSIDGVFFLHPNFKLSGTVTGRPSCENPNLQQVPRDVLIRSLITAPPGWTLMEFDLEQVELKIVAEMSRDPTMVHAFRTGVDIHWLTMIREFARSGAQAELVLDTVRTYKQDKKIRYAEALDILLKMGPDVAIEINPVWKEMRKKAKAINFGYVYGMWWKKFKLYARDNYDVEVTDNEARESREAFFDTYKLEDWHKARKRYARRNGYVKSYTGRKRRLPAAQSSHDSPARGAAERQAVNAPVQGFAAEMNLMSALQVRKEFSRDIVRVVGTIHDAILMWVRNEHIAEVGLRVLKIMQWPDLFDVFEIEFDVPITADCKVGPWAAGISFKKWLKENGYNEQGKRSTSTRPSGRHAKKNSRPHTLRVGNTSRDRDRRVTHH